MLFITTISFSLFFSLTTSTSPFFDLPPANYTNGTAQPFYPCGYTADQVSKCPYRCLNYNGDLESSCYDEEGAGDVIREGLMCVKCEVPTQPEDYAGGCTSLDPVAYFTQQHPNISPCGTAGAELTNCPYICGEAAVPIGLCGMTNDTHPFKICYKCQPQCSSPLPVFAPPYLPQNFSLSGGSCSSEYGAPELRWCPFRCSKVGLPNQFCSARDQTDIQAYVNCTKCYPLA